MMPNLRIKSSQRRLLVLLLFTFLVGTMITIVNYNQNLNQQRFVLSDNDRTALLNYFKYSQSKRNLVSEVATDQINLIQHDQFKKLISSSNRKSSSSSSSSSSLPNNHQQQDNSPSNQLDNQPNSQSIKNLPEPLPQQSVGLNKLSSTTFSDSKESSTKFLINRDNRDVDSKDNQKDNQNLNQKDNLIKSNELNDKVNSSRKPITQAPLTADKNVNQTSGQQAKQLDQLKSNKAVKQNLNKSSVVVKAPPVFVHTDAELALTQQFEIDKKGYCSKEHGYGLDLLVMVVTSPANFEARSAIRQTWGGFAVERGSKLLFVVGRSPVPEINDKLKQEDSEYEDILQGSFQDAYYNLTLKSLAIVNWVADNCEKAKYILKIDDDMFVNMQLLVDFAETREFKNVIIGKIAKKWLPHRDSKSKWYVPSAAYAGQVYPNFATGPAYLIHRDAIPNLAKVIRSNATKVIKLEDVFLAGIVAEKAGVRRLNYSLFKNAYFEVNKCNFQRFITSHQHSPKEIIRLWALVYSDKKVDCAPIKKPAVTKAPISKPKSSPVQIKKAQPSEKTKTESKTGTSKEDKKTN